MTINRPPRDGRMAFVRSPDNISIELLQKGGSLPPREPWVSMPNTGRLVSAQTAERRAAFRAGQRAILPSLPGAAAWGLVSGVAMVKGGLAVPWAIMMSLLVYAGSAQLAALPLIAAGAPLWVIVATGLITNLRFVIYSAALRPLFRERALAQARRARLLHDRFHLHAVHAAAQEGTLPERHRDAWFAGVCSNNWITWQCRAITGIVGASYVPTDWGLEFTGTLALVALVGPSAECAARAWSAPWSAAVVALLAHPHAVQARPVLRRHRRHRRRDARRSAGSASAAARVGGRMNEPVAGIALAVVIVGLALSTFLTRTSFLLAGRACGSGTASKSRCATRRCARSRPSSCRTC